MGALDDAIREHLELKRRHGASDEEIRQAEAEALGPARRTPGSGLNAVPGETALDEAGMPAPVEAFEPPPDPGSAVHDAPPPPVPDEGFVAEGPPVHDAAPDPAAVPPPGLEPEPLAASQPIEPVEPVAPADPIQPVEPEPVAAAEPVQPVPPVEPAPPAPEPIDPAPLHDAVGSNEANLEPPEVEPDAYAPPEPPPDDPERARTAILDDPLRDPPPVHHEPDPDEPPAPARPPEAAAPPAPGADQAEEDVLEETPDFLQETPEHDRLWFEQKPPRDFDFD